MTTLGIMENANKNKAGQRRVTIREDFHDFVEPQDISSVHPVSKRTDEQLLRAAFFNASQSQRSTSQPAPVADPLGLLRSSVRVPVEPPLSRRTVSRASASEKATTASSRWGRTTEERKRITRLLCIALVVFLSVTLVLYVSEALHESASGPQRHRPSLSAPSSPSTPAPYKRAGASNRRMRNWQQFSPSPPLTTVPNGLTTIKADEAMSAGYSASSEIQVAAENYRNNNFIVDNATERIPAARQSSTERDHRVT